METLGSSVAQLHAWWYLRAARDFPYERRSRSAACIPPGHGDFDNGALVGGTPLRVLHLVEEGLRGALHDIRHGLNSAYESHLDRYFFLPKPATLLSPGYGWDAVLRPPVQVRHVKVLRRSKGGLVTASAAGPRDSGPATWPLAAGHATDLPVLGRGNSRRRERDLSPWTLTALLADAGLRTKR